MEHKKTIFYFEARGVEWRVEYQYIEIELNKVVSNKIAVTIYEGGRIYHDFGINMPRIKTHNLTKTHAKEIITAARKINKTRDKRDQNINTILNGSK